MKRRKISSTLPSSREVIRQGRSARTAINAVALILALAFAWLKFKGIPFTPVVETFTATVLLHSALGIYYFSWMFGLINDTHEQELVYTQPLKNVAIHCLIFGLLFFLAFGGLCYVKTEYSFSLVLGIFLVGNVLSWQYYVKIFLKATTKATRADFTSNRDYISLEYLRTIYDDYLCGVWQWKRFATGGIIISLIAILAIYPGPPRSVIEIIQPVQPNTLIASLLLLFVLVMESWIWMRRFRVKNNIALLGDIQGKYHLRPHDRESE